MPWASLVFPTAPGCLPSPDYVHEIVSQACRRAGIDGRRLGPPTWRHTLAPNFLSNGGDLLTSQHILDHASLEVVKLNVHLDTNDLRAQQRKYGPMYTLTMGQGTRSVA